MDYTEEILGDRTNVYHITGHPGKYGGVYFFPTGWDESPAVIIPNYYFTKPDQLKSFIAAAIAALARLEVAVKERG